MGQGQKLTLILVSISLFCTWGEDILKHYYTSIYGAMCYDTCRTSGYNYYWCNTVEGWDYCSPSENLDYEGYECKYEHSCEKHGYSYYWCERNAGGWGYCGRVELKVLLHLSSIYQSVCIDQCKNDDIKNYYWCYTGEGWDYCSPYRGVTYKNKPCRSDYPCSTHGHSYTWCKTETTDWDYCGLIVEPVARTTG